MTIAPRQSVTLQDFLKLSYINEAPAWKYRNGTVLCYRPNQLPQILDGESLLPYLAEIAFKITPQDIFRWLRRRS
ncbi:hypothetical protein PN498_23620 [Oscillatoria sp. CS-180]|uniref:hypothetical protein n=1 Tax=Oscillatoria sp. CS-180 TaxID=3021720 RepID=UPI00232E4963|nr:hypothetical protein [Oscillatoria sp. CS-180]MDB9529002.1 hypothetical protein [Oscillatoria sp. CS-180]